MVKKNKDAAVEAAKEVQRCHQAREAAKKNTIAKKKLYEAAQDAEAKAEDALQKAHGHASDVARTLR